MLTDDDIQRFVRTGYVHIREAFPRRLASECRDLAFEQLGVAESPPWNEPVVRGVVEGEPVRQAANAPRLLDAIGQLLHGERWQPRPNLGLFVVRCPSAVDPGDAGWHIDASFEGPDADDYATWYVNYRSKGRGLLLLCLLSDIGPDDAPTRILEGSHRLMPRLLLPFGEAGIAGLMAPLPQPDAPIAVATGTAGDVYVCHPFLVHAASWPHSGTRPRIVAQPPIALDGSLRLDADGDEISVVASTIRTVLDDR